jgi:hypothetical protein
MVSRNPIRPSFSRDLGVIYNPTKCKGSFSIDFGQSVFIEEFGYLEWMEMSAQCKLIDMTDFPPKAKRPTLPKLYNIADLLACVDNLINMSIRVFKWLMKLHASKHFYTAIKMRSWNEYNRARRSWNVYRTGQMIC